MTATEIRREEMMYEMRQNSHLHRFGKFYLKTPSLFLLFWELSPFLMLICSQYRSDSSRALIVNPKLSKGWGGWKSVP